MRPTITGIAHVELSVSDVDASVAWYCRVLGPKDVWRGQNDEGEYRACAIREPVLPLLAFAVMTHLLQTRLTDIDVRGSLKMIKTDFLVHARSLLVPRPEARLSAVVPPDPGTAGDPAPGVSATVRVGRTSTCVVPVDA